jgi:hypothetical protein
VDYFKISLRHTELPEFCSGQVVSESQPQNSEIKRMDFPSQKKPLHVYVAASISIRLLYLNNEMCPILLYRLPSISLNLIL